MIIPVQVETKPVSPSAYTLRVNDCPKQFQLRRVIKVPETPGLYNPAGDTVHVVTAVLDYLMAHVPSLQEAINIAIRAAEHPGLALELERWMADSTGGGDE